MMNLAINIGRESLNILRAQNVEQVKEKAVHISEDDYEYIIDYMFENCGGYFNEVFQVGPDYEYNLNLEGRIKYEKQYSDYPSEVWEEATIVLDLLECRKAVYRDGKELDYIEGELVKTDFDPSRIHGQSRIIE